MGWFLALLAAHTYTEQFKFASEDNACSHILFAACHDNAYLSQLVPFSGARSKITLVQGAGFISEFHQYKLNITQFPTVFRWSELPTTAATTSTSSTTNSGPPQELPAPKSATSYVPLHLRRTQGSWRERSVDTETSTTAYDESSSTKTDGFGDDYGSGQNEKSTKKNPKPSCRYFQKVELPSLFCFVLVLTRLGLLSEWQQMQLPARYILSRQLEAPRHPTAG